MSNALVKLPDASELSGAQKTAILLMALGEEASAQITKSMAPEEVEQISLEIARMGRVDPETVEAVLEEWSQTERAASYIAQGGVDFARRILEKSYGPKRAGTMLKRIETQLSGGAISLEHLRHADVQQLSALIRNEYPQTIALILAYLEPEQTAEVLKTIDTHTGSDILLRLAKMEKVLPDVLGLLEESLGEEADISLGGGALAGGPSAVAEVLNLLSAGAEKELLDGVAEYDVALSEKIKDLMFVFEDIGKLDTPAITRLLRDVQTRDLSIALKLASDELKDKILDSMSSRARDSLTEEMEFLGPMKVSDVEAAQAEIVKMARALGDAGEIVIGASDDMVVV